MPTKEFTKASLNTAKTHQILQPDLGVVPESASNIALPEDMNGHGIRLLRLLGSGTYGSVYLGEGVISGSRVAVKIIPKKADGEPSSALVEVETLSELKHPNIIKHYSVQETSAETRIVMRLAENGDLLRRTLDAGKHSESKARQFFTQILKAVAHAHEQGWIHRDIKLENILLDGADNALLADWGLACRWSPRSFLEESVGSLHYASPEIVRGACYVGPEVDSWSLGVVLYALVVGAFPFGDNAEAVVAGALLNPVRCVRRVRGTHPWSSGARPPKTVDCRAGSAAPVHHRRQMDCTALGLSYPWRRPVGASNEIASHLRREAFPLQSKIVQEGEGAAERRALLPAEACRQLEELTSFPRIEFP